MRLISKLHENRLRALSFFNLESYQLSQTYGKGKWNIHQLLHHIADAEQVFLERLKRVIVQDKPEFLGLEPNSWCASLNHPNKSIHKAGMLFDACRTSLIELLEQHLEKDGGREGIHPERGPMTFKALAEFLLCHQEHHLDFAQKALDNPV